MKSLSQKLKMDRRGQVGINGVVATVIAAVVGIFIIAALFYGMGIFTGLGLFPAGSQSANDTTDMTKNVTSMAKNFTSQLPTAGTILGAVFILGIIGLLVYTVIRWQMNTRGGGGLA